MMLRSYLHKLGFRYRVNYSLFGRPDIVFPKKKIAVFVHGCFWHRHRCKNSVIPKTNTEFWKEKLKENIERDCEVRSKLIIDGWKVLVVWECKIENIKKLEKEILKNLRKVVKYDYQAQV